MIQELLEIKPSDSIPEMCTRMGTFLGLSGQIPEEAIRRAIEDQDYANNLITCRNSPEFLKALLNDPQNKNYVSEKSDDGEVSNANLIQNAASAFIRWGKAGFSVVDDDTLERREDACLACENLVKPEKTLQKLITSKSKDKIGKRAADCVCNLCGCSISKKIRLPSESCPGKDPNNAELNRWGEPFSVTE
jgi:hypothetical protein